MGANGTSSRHSGKLFLLGATKTLSSTHDLPEPRMRTFYCLMVLNDMWRHLVADQNTKNY